MDPQATNSGLIALCLGIIIVIIIGWSLLRNLKEREVERINTAKSRARVIASEVWSIIKIDRVPVAKRYIEEYHIVTLRLLGGEDELVNREVLFFRPHHIFFTDLERLTAGDEVEFLFCETCLVKGSREDIESYLRVKKVQAPK